jgi:hypothetical protein
MKAVAIVILFPLISVIVVSLYVHGGASRIVTLVLLTASFIGAVISFICKRNPRPNK